MICESYCPDSAVFTPCTSKASRGPMKSIEGWVIIITGVHDEARDEDIYETFSEFGEILNLHMNLDRRSGFVKGYALIEYSTKKSAEQALNEMDGYKLLGKKVRAD